MRRITTYDRLHRHVQAWKMGEIGHLVIMGEPGLGKSWAVKTAIDGQPHHWFSARQSPIEVYCHLHDQPDLMAVFDDVTSLLREDNFVDMLKNLCEDGIKTLRWGTKTEKLEGRARSFECESRVLILLNRLPEKNPDVRAVLDRHHVVLFNPSKTEVIAYMRQHFPEDSHLINLLATLPCFPSVRTLIRARELARSTCLDLHQELLAESGVRDGIAMLIQIMETYPETEWCRRYIDTTGTTDRTYRRDKILADQILECRKSVWACPGVRVETSVHDVNTPALPAVDGGIKNGESEAGIHLLP